MDGYRFVILAFNPVPVRRMQSWLKGQKEAGEDEAREKWADAALSLGARIWDTILDLVAEGYEYIDYQDPPEVAIDPTLHMWIFTFYNLSASHSLSSEPAPDADPNSEGDSTGSPTVLDEMEEEPINPES